MVGGLLNNRDGAMGICIGIRKFAIWGIRKYIQFLRAIRRETDAERRRRRSDYPRGFGCVEERLTNRKIIVFEIIVPRMTRSQIKNAGCVRVRLPNR